MGKQCVGCKKYYPIEFFNFKNKKEQRRQIRCKFCTRKQVKKHYDANREYYLQKATKGRTKYEAETHQYLCEYLSNHPCVDCGEKDILVLEFDHQRDKDKDISWMVRYHYSLDRIKKEIEKCEVRCANCHRRKTAIQFGHYRYKYVSVAQQI